MILLPNGCKCSELSVFPKNWKSRSASFAKDWYISYRFYDPKVPKPKQVTLKGMNSFKTYLERKEATETLLTYELQRLKIEGFNPISGIMQPEITVLNDYEICSFTPFYTALEKAFKQFNASGATAADVRSMMKRVGAAINELQLHQMPIGMITRKHIVYLLEYITRTHKTFSAHGYNKYRSYLMSLFKVLYKVEAVTHNPVRDIEKMKVIKRLRVTLTIEERAMIKEHLSKNYPEFWKFVQIFFHSGGREIELLSLKVKDVNLKAQTYKALIKKGRQYTEVLRTIKNIALPLWVELLSGADPEHYVFSKGLVPNVTMIRREQITRRWNWHVKKKLNISADMYSLKHSNLDEIAGMLNAQDAARQAGHTTPIVTINHYLVGEKERQHNRLKKVHNEF